MLPDLPQTEIAIVEMTNTFRKASALQEVRPNAALSVAARAFAQYIASSGKFGHGADGREPHERTEAAGYKHCLVAENLAWNADSRGFETRQLAGEFLQGWKDSPGHRENLLLPEVTEIGVAVVQAPYRTPKFVAVQLFGRPEAAKISFTIRNVSRSRVQYVVGEEADTLEPSAMVTHDRCDLPQLVIEKAAGANVRFAPRNGDLFVIRAVTGKGVDVGIERK